MTNVVHPDQRQRARAAVRRALRRRLPPATRDSTEGLAAITADVVAELERAGLIVGLDRAIDDNVEGVPI